MQLDTTTEFGLRVLRRLSTEQIIWLSTVSSQGVPQPSPVWFLWENNEFVIYSRPDQAKLRNIQARPQVSLHFDGDGRGGDIVVFTGTARILTDPRPADSVVAYATKYAAGIKRINMTPATFAAAYSAAISITPSSLRGH